MKNIVLIGFMGTGKTSVGQLLAGRLKLSFVDVDKKIEKENEISISEMFAKHGEAYFRKKEQQAISRISRRRNLVIATGGGAVLFPENMDRLRAHGTIISLTASLETILERTGRLNTRPLLDCADREKAVADLLEKRAEFYKKADLIIDTDHLSPYQTVELIVAFLRREGEEV